MLNWWYLLTTDPDHDHGDRTGGNRLMWARKGFIGRLLTRVATSPVSREPGSRPDEYRLFLSGKPGSRPGENRRFRLWTMAAEELHTHTLRWAQRGNNSWRVQVLARRIFRTPLHIGYEPGGNSGKKAQAEKGP